MHGNKEAILIGYSGHGFVMGDCAIEMGIRLKYYGEQKQQSNNPLELEYLGFDGEEDFAGYGKGFLFMVGIGDNAIRVRISEKLRSRSEILVNVIHPSSHLSRFVKLGDGIFISRSTTINPGVEIGDFAIVNTGSVVEHECLIGKGAHIAPGTILCGNVTVGAGSFIGANTVVRQGITIGSNVTVGAGSVVISNLEDNSMFAGNPARRIK